MRKAPILYALTKQQDKSRNQNHGGPGAFSVPRPPTECKEENMIFPYKSTGDERTAISNAMWPIFTGLEQAETLLRTCLEDHFEDYPQKAITESEAEWLADMLHIVDTALHDAILC